MNNENITIQDCLDNYKKGKSAIIENGQVIEFVKED